MNSYIQISFKDLQPEQQELLIAHLSEAGFEGFEEGNHELKAFIPEASYDKQLLHELAYKYQLQFSEQLIPEQNWNAVWESSFQPVIVDDFTAVRADFHQPVTNVLHEIIITPKMSFGTGHHATTYMMVRQMRNIDFSGKKVFDFGTGTGILAILAEKLGAADITAIDNDDWSISNAAENLERNHCRKVKLYKAGSIPQDEQYDIMLANINKNVILENFSALTACLVSGGILLLSGLLEEDKAEMQEQAVLFSLHSGEILQQNGWICLRFNH